MLSDKSKYPTFMRTVSAYSSWMPAVVAFAQWAEWTRLAIVSTMENLFALTAPTLTRLIADAKLQVALDLRFEHGQFESSELDRFTSLGVRDIYTALY
jgi:hypothetical protein